MISVRFFFSYFFLFFSASFDNVLQKVGGIGSALQTLISIGTVQKELNLGLQQDTGKILTLEGMSLKPRHVDPSLSLCLVLLTRSQFSSLLIEIYELIDDPLLTMHQQKVFDQKLQVYKIVIIPDLKQRSFLVSGLSVVLENLNRMRYMAHFRAVHRGAYFQTMRTTEARVLLPDAWGFVCPVHTPDGTPCGLLNHLARDCEVLLNEEFVRKQTPIHNTLGLLDVR